MHCSALESIVIPMQVESIHAKAFAGCDNLETIVIHPGIQNIQIDDTAFIGCHKAKIYIPSENGSTIELNHNYIVTVTAVMSTIYDMLNDSSPTFKNTLTIPKIVQSVNTTMILTTKETDANNPEKKTISYNPQDISNLLEAFELQTLEVHHVFVFNKHITSVNSDNIDLNGITKEVYDTLVKLIFKDHESPLKANPYSVDSENQSTRFKINQQHNMTPRMYLSLGYIVGQMLCNAFDVTLEIPLSYVDIGILVVIYILKYYAEIIKDNNNIDKLTPFLHEIIKACACHSTDGGILNGSCSGAKVEHKYNFYYDELNKTEINNLIVNENDDGLTPAEKDEKDENDCLRQFYTGIVDKFMYNSKYVDDISKHNFGNMLQFVSKSTRYMESLMTFLTNHSSTPQLPFLTSLTNEFGTTMQNISEVQKQILEKQIKRCYRAITASSGIPVSLTFGSCAKQYLCPEIHTCFNRIDLPENVDAESLKYGYFNYIYNVCNNILLGEAKKETDDKKICILKLCEKGDVNNALGWMPDIHTTISDICPDKYTIEEKTFCCKEELEFNLDDYQLNSLYHLIIITHGSPKSIMVGENESMAYKDASFYKLADKLQDKLAHNASILFASCSVGRIEDMGDLTKKNQVIEHTNTTYDNFANKLSEKLQGIHIYATPNTQVQHELSVSQLKCDDFVIGYTSNKQPMYKYLTN